MTQASSMPLFQRLLLFDLRHVRFLFLFAAVLVYAFLGSPTPDNPSMVEVIIAVLLVLAVGVSGTIKAIWFRFDEPAWIGVAQVFFIFGISVPLVVGFLNGK